jgi:hypothetical protein
MEYVKSLGRLSAGRLVVGLGQGWSADEFAAANVPMRRRGSGFEEFIEALRATWGPDPISYQGRFYRIAPSQVSPKTAAARPVGGVVGAVKRGAHDARIGSLSASTSEIRTRMGPPPTRYAGSLPAEIRRRSVLCETPRYAAALAISIAWRWVSMS